MGSSSCCCSQTGRYQDLPGSRKREEGGAIADVRFISDEIVESPKDEINDRVTHPQPDASNLPTFTPLVIDMPPTMPFFPDDTRPACSTLSPVLEDDHLEEDLSPVSQHKSPPKATEEVHWMQKIYDSYTSENNMSDKEREFFAEKPTSAPRRPSTLQPSFVQYAEKYSGLYDQLRTMEGKDGWTFKKTLDTVDIFTKSLPGDDMLYTKGITTMQTHGNGIRHLVSHMLTAEDRPKYDEVCDYGATVESYLPHYRIVYFRMKSPTSLISARDVLTLSRLSFEKDGSLLLVSESTEHISMPESAPYVRVRILGGYVIRPTSDPDVYTIMFSVKADPGGWLPGWVKNLIAWKAQLVMVNFKKYYDSNFSKSA